MVAVLAIGFALTLFLQQRNKTSQLTERLNISVLNSPEQQVFRTDIPALAISPDGAKLAYSITENGVTQLYIRPMNSFEATPIKGTENASAPFFSPDGQWIGFRGSGRLWKISLFGGKPLSLCSAPGGLTAAWGNGTIIFTPQFNLGLWQVSEDGGEPKPLTEPDETKQEAGHRFPQILPDGEHVLFTIKPPSSNFDEATIATLSLKTGKIKRLFTGGSFARYLPTGHQYICSIRNSWPRRLILTGSRWLARPLNCWNP